MKTETIKVKNMDCGGCKRNIENAIKEIDGVNDVSADLSTKIVTINYEGNPMMPKIFRAVLEDYGFPENK